MSAIGRNRARGRKVNRRQRTGQGKVRTPLAMRQAVGATLKTARRLALPSVLGAAAVTLLWVAGLYVTNGPYFRLRNAEIHGLHRLTEAEVLNTIDLQRDVSSTLGLEPEGLAAGLREHPWIVDAEVERWLPDRLTIRVTERVPEVVVLPYADPADGVPAAPMLADAYGHRFARPHRPSDVDLPAITGVDLPDAGADLEGVSDKRLKTALSAMREWRRQGLDALDDLSEVHVDQTAGLTLYTQRDGSAIRLGRRDLAARLAHVRAALSDIHARGERAEYVLADDSRDGGRVVVRTTPRKPPGAADAALDLPTDAERGEVRRTGHGKEG